MRQGFIIKPPIGIEPITYSLRNCRLIPIGAVRPLDIQLFQSRITCKIVGKDKANSSARYNHTAQTRPPRAGRPAIS